LNIVFVYSVGRVFLIHHSGKDFGDGEEGEKKDLMFFTLSFSGR